MQRFEGYISEIFAALGLHRFPFFGQAYIGYIPHEHLADISELTRLVRLFAKRFSVQERLGEQTVTIFETLLAPHGVAVFFEAHHLCAAMRGGAASGKRDLRSYD